MTAGSAAPEAGRDRVFAEVALDASDPRAPRPAGAPDATFHYSVPAQYQDDIAVGQLVWVPFGPRQLQGLVVGVAPRAPVDRTREILAIVEPRPWVTAAGVALARWMSHHYRAALFACLKPMLPPGASTRVETVYRRTDQAPLATMLTPAESQALALFGPERTLSRAQLARRDKSALGLVDQLVAAGLLAVDRRPTVAAASRRKAAPTQGMNQPRISAEPMLSDDQTHAWAELRALLEAPPAATQPTVCLIHGVTGSGKTELYIQAIRHVLARGDQAIALVPEIALTPQTIMRFADRLVEPVALWHSELTPAERRDTWRRAHAGEIGLIVGSRSAVFAPLPRLGLIVVDEEHADSYKQEVSPRYHARDVAVRRGALTGVPVLLGSATPAVETWQAAATGRYRRVSLPRRVASGGPSGARPAWAPLPAVNVVDMRAELRAGHTSIFSRALTVALAETLASGAQAILFLNRRGSASFVLCRDCGHVQSCPRCQLPLTYHQAQHDLVCHHCNHHAPPPIMCPQCASPRIRYFGLGTQKVESTLLETFPRARVLRWDADTTGTRGAHGALLERFAAGEADVLVGTQMIAKGLDLPDVTLVGVVLADTALNLPDFRSAERTFQMLAQVAGRSGRSARGGQVVFQTYRPDDPAIQAAARHDAAEFYRAELAFRAALRYPPYARLIRLEHLAASDRAAQQSADRLAEDLRLAIDRLGLADTDVIGPAPAFFHHVRGQVRWQLVLRGPDPHAALGAVSLGPGWRVDVDPVSLL